jgi:nucleoside phosphorylase
VSLADDSGKASYDDIVERLLPELTPEAAQTEVYRRMGAVNKAAEKEGLSFRFGLTKKSSAHPVRWLHFTEPEREVVEPPRTLGLDLRNIPVVVKQSTVDMTPSFVAPEQLFEPSSDPVERPIVLMTFNHYETQAVVNRFSGEWSATPIQTLSGLPYLWLGSVVHRVGEEMKRQMVILASSLQGVSRAQDAAEDACADWKPQVMIGVGIAFGADPAEQRIGDVLVSKMALEYEMARVEPEGDITSRATELPASDTWMRRFQLVDHLASDPKWPKIHVGGILSGNKLVDNAEFRNALVALRPSGQIIGGEMESVGLARAAERSRRSGQNVDWITVKGICDFADGTLNKRGKSQRQQKAARQAAEVVYQAVTLSSLHAPRNTQAKKDSDMTRSLTDEEMDQPLGDFMPSETVRPALEDITQYLKIQVAPVGLSDMLEEPKNARRATADCDEKGILKDRPVLPELFEWAADDKRGSLFILLGEYGMGKTVACQSFDLDLRNRWESGEANRYALYFDLRHVQGLVAKSTEPTGSSDTRLPSVVEIMIECARKGWEQNPEVTPEQLWQWIGEGAVVIFDGLDEVLTRIDDRSGRDFTDQLISVVYQAKPVDGRPPKVVISTRTQFFRTLREQREILTGQATDHLRLDAMEARLLLGLRDEEIERYLRKALPEHDISQVRKMLASVYDLEDLAQRPVTLPFIAQAVPEIKRLRDEGKPIYGVTLYREFSRRWLGREVEKSRVKRSDKLILAEDMAAMVWRGSGQEIHVDKLEEWFESWRAERSNWRKYEKYDFEVLEEDLRNATFLKRRDDSADGGYFRFSHTSLHEFFLSEYLLRALRDDAPERWDMRNPSDETWDFFGQSLKESGDQALADRMGQWFSGQWALSGERNQTEKIEAVNDVILGYRASAWRGKGWPQASSVDCTESVDLVEKYDRGDPADVLRLIRSKEITSGDRVSLGGRVWQFLGVLNGKGQLSVSASRRKAINLDVRTVGRTERAALFLAEHPVDYRSYHQDRNGASWYDSSLRQWLTGPFFDSLKSRMGEARFAEVQQDNEPKKKYQYRKWNQQETHDPVFLLSNIEADRIFADDQQRIMKRNDGNAWWWWLRSPGVRQFHSAVVDRDGNVHDDGDYWRDDTFASAAGAVRPALALNLES